MTTQNSVLSISSEFILFVLVHGLNGNEHDMNRIKSFIGFFANPHILVLKKISAKISDSLDIIGKTAA
jgi:fumarate reductase subunit C